MLNHSLTFDFVWGWNCFPETQSPTVANLCSEGTVPVTLNSIPGELQTYTSVVPPNYIACSTTPLQVQACFKNLSPVELIPQLLTINPQSGIQLINNLTSPSITVLSGGATYGLTNPAPPTWDIVLNTAPTMVMNDAFCINFEIMTNGCNIGLIQLPKVQIDGEDACGNNFSTIFTLPLIPQTTQAPISFCNDCYTITKSASVATAAPGDPVMFTITVCGNNANGGTVTLTDVLPQFFTPSVTIPASVSVPANGCTYVYVPGIYTDVIDCPNDNTATIIHGNGSQTATACINVECPDPATGQYHATLSDYIASSVFSGNQNPTGDLIFVADNVQLIIDIPMQFDNCTFIMGSGSSIYIQNGLNFNLINNTLIYSCPQMWAGIRVGTGAQIEVRNSTIKDAEFAIILEDHANYDIRDSYILNCVTGLHTQPAQPGSLYNISGNVTGTQFAKTALLLRGEYPGQPMHGNVGRAGIWFNDVAYINIGDNGNSENEFFNINFGIETHNSSVDIENCRFHDIVVDGAYSAWAQNAALKPFGCGVHARGMDEPSTVNVLPLSSGNTTIENAPVGVYTNFINARIQGVSMYNVMKGVNSELSVARTVSVNGCNIHARFRGIDFNENDNAFNMVATGNEIYLEPVLGVGKGQACIYMRETQLGNNAHYNISDNWHLETLSGQAGIVTLNVENAYIGYNYIYTNVGTQLPAPGSVGIAISGGARNTINCNGVTNTIPLSNLGTVGMMVSTSQNNSIGFNGFNGSYTGMRFYAQCGGTNMYGNSMANNFKGLQLNSNAEIGAQLQRGNVFTGNYSASLLSNDGADNLNNTLLGLQASEFRVHQGMGTVNGISTYYYPKLPQYDFCATCFVPLYGGTGGQAGSQSATDWFNNLPGTPFSCATSTVCMSWEERVGDGYERMIAAGSIETVDYKPESKAMAKQYLFETLFLNDTLLQSDSVYQEFYADNEATDIGQLNEVEATLKEARYDDSFMQLILQTSNLIALKMDSIRLLDSLSTTDSTLNFTQQRATLINSIDLMQQALNNMKAQQQAVINSKLNDALQVNQIVVPDEVPQNNQKVMNGIIANTRLQGETYAQMQIQTALAIAHQCPYSGGPAVYQARAFIERFYNETEEYDDANICLQQGIYRQGEQQAKDISARDFTVYPNPAQDKINIEIKNKITGICKLEILSTAGVNVWTTEYNCEEKKHEADISNLTQGMYYVRIAFNNEYRFISKLAIIR